MQYSSLPNKVFDATRRDIIVLSNGSIITESIPFAMHRTKKAWFNSFLLGRPKETLLKPQVV